MRHYASSSEKSLVVAPVKITIACARLFLLRSTTSSRQTPLLRFPPDGEKLLCGVAPPLPPKGTAALIAKNGRSARFFAKRLPTTFVRLNALRRFFVLAALPRRNKSF